MLNYDIELTWCEAEKQIKKYYKHTKVLNIYYYIYNNKLKLKYSFKFYHKINFVSIIFAK